MLTGMNDVHGTHGATGIIENPLLLEVHVGLGRGGLKVRHDIGDNGAGVVAMLGDSTLRESVQLSRVENVEALEVGLEENIDAVKKRC